MDMDVEKAYSDFNKSSQTSPNQTSLEDKIDVLLAQNQEIQVDTQRTADAVAEETAGNDAEEDAIGEDFAETAELEIDEDEPAEELEPAEDMTEEDSDIEGYEGEDSDLDEVSEEDSDIEGYADDEENEEDSDIDGYVESEESEESEDEGTDETEEDESDEGDSEEEDETTEDEEDDELEKAHAEIQRLRRENFQLKKRLYSRPISKTEEVKPLTKQIKPITQTVQKVSKPPSTVAYGNVSVRPATPTDMADDEPLVIGIGKNWKKSVEKEWKVYRQMGGL